MLCHVEDEQRRMQRGRFCCREHKVKLNIIPTLHCKNRRKNDQSRPLVRQYQSTSTSGFQPFFKSNMLYRLQICTYSACSQNAPRTDQPIVTSFNREGELQSYLQTLPILSLNFFDSKHS